MPPCALRFGAVWGNGRLGPVVRIGTAPLSAEKSVDYVSKVGWYRGTLLRLVLFCGILLQSGRAFLFFGPADTIDAHTVRDKERKYL